MSTLQAIIGHEEEMRKVAPPDLATVSLADGFAIWPLDSGYQKRHGEFPLPVMVEKAAARLRVCAHVEADLAGAGAAQSAALYRGGGRIGGTETGDGSINRALGRIGVQVRAPLDEFDTLGLGRHRETDGWLTESSAPPVPTVAEETPRRKPQERVLGIVVTLLLLVITVWHAWCALIHLIAADMNKNDGYVVLAIAGMFPALALFRRIFLARWSPVDLIVLLIGVSAEVFSIIWSSLHLGGPLPVTVLLVYAAATAGTAYLVRQSHVAGRHRGNPYPGR